MDLRRGRFTNFEPSGAYVSDVITPDAAFTPVSSFGGVLTDASTDMMAILVGESSGARMNRYDVNNASEEVVREERSPPGPWDVECGEVIDGIPDRSEGWVFIAREGHLIFAGDTGDATVLRVPMYVPQVPDEQEVAQREEELKAFNRGLGLPESMNLATADSGACRSVIPFRSPIPGHADQ